MLKPGDKVKLTYYEGEGQSVSYNWLVEEYDNGLLKATRELTVAEIVTAADTGREPMKETTVFNLRSIGFLKAELVEPSQE